MPFTPEQKQRLIAAYEPILYFHPGERWLPVDPARFLERAALWCTQPADAAARHDKENWGGCRPGGEGGYPRAPLVPRNGISLNPAHDTEGAADPDLDGVNEWYLGRAEDDGSRPYLTSHEGRMLWLENSGWEEGEAVSADSTNEVCGVERAATRWQEEPYRSASDRFYADVADLDEYGDVIGELQQQGITSWDEIRAPYGRAWILTFHYLFPVHEAGDRHLWSYEGDWNAVAIILPEPDELRRLTDPAELTAAIDRLLARWEADGSYAAPELVAFGRRARGVSEEETYQQQMNFHRAEHLALVGTHPRVFVARGAHNFYATTGPQEPPGSAPPACEPSWIEPSDYDREVDEIAWSVTPWVAAGKLFGGAGIGSAGGPIGAVVGLIIGGICYAAEMAAPIAYGATADEGDIVHTVPSPEQDLPPELGEYGLVLVPPGRVADFPDAEQAREVRPWAGTPAQKVLDRATQVWWASAAGHRGYDGRWGAMCQHDPCDARSGMPQPDFRRVLLEELWLHLSG